MADRNFMQIRANEIQEILPGSTPGEQQLVDTRLSHFEFEILDEMMQKAQKSAKEMGINIGVHVETVFGVKLTAVWGAK
jgi:hypothetical protein